MNQAAMNTKFISADVAFDEGGIGSETVQQRQAPKIPC
jgi:hypothetical protein